LLLAVALAACGPETDQRPMLLLDAVARANGYELRVGDWKGAPVTPISVTPMDDVVLTGPTGTQHLTPRPGALGQIEGHQGALRWRSLGTELDPGQLVVRGHDADAVQHLAKTLDARAVQHGDGEWMLEGDAVLEQSAWLEVPAGVNEVQPVDLAGPAPLQVPKATFQVAGAVAPSSASVQLVDEVPAYVGTYLAEDESLVLDASGGYQMMHECDLSTGHFFVAGATLVLVSDEGPRRELTIGAQGDLGDNFTHFAALRFEP
jgi:hypothetical protein